MGQDGRRRQAEDEDDGGRNRPKTGSPGRVAHGLGVYSWTPEGAVDARSGPGRRPGGGAPARSGAPPGPGSREELGVGPGDGRAERDEAPPDVRAGAGDEARAIRLDAPGAGAGLGGGGKEVVDAVVGHVVHGRQLQRVRHRAVSFVDWVYRIEKWC